MTKHAGVQVQHRRVDRTVLDCVLTYGHHEPAHLGGQVVTFDRQSLDDLAGQEDRPATRRASDFGNLCAIVTQWVWSLPPNIDFAGFQEI